MKTLNSEFLQNTLSKIESVINIVLQHYDVDMQYDLNKRNEIFCDILNKTKFELKEPEMREKIEKILSTKPNDLSKEDSEWLSEQIYEYHKDLFLLHYFYAILYSYNYDAEIQEKISEFHINGFFEKANIIHKKYKNLTKLK